MIETLQRHATRMTVAAMLTFGAGVLVSLLLGKGTAARVADLVALAAVGVALVAMFFLFVRPLPLDEGEPRTVHPPVRGRWRAMNSPATKVPSHGIRAYGQSHAVDLVHEPVDGPERPAFGAGPGMRRPEEFPAFGQPALSMVDGTVVRVRDGQRDHRSRSRVWAVLVMMLEGMVRELRGADGVVGNHVVVDAGDGTYALLAHVRRGSACVREGEVVRAGQQVAECGNTGNSSEPHVHAQLMDRPSAAVARGLAMQFAGVVVGDGSEPVAGMPANDEHVLA